MWSRFENKPSKSIKWIVSIYAKTGYISITFRNHCFLVEIGKMIELLGWKGTKWRWTALRMLYGKWSFFFIIWIKFILMYEEKCRFTWQKRIVKTKALLNNLGLKSERIFSNMDLSMACNTLFTPKVRYENLTNSR